MNALSKTLVPFLKQSLNAYSIRHQVLAENIANVDTPNFKPLKVTFEENLRNILDNRNLKGRKTDNRHLDVGKAPLEVRTLDELEKQHGPLNLENEMAELAKNQIRYEFVAKRLAGSYEFIRTSILGRIR